MQNIFIHPGFSKSGTTTLQKIFTNLKNFESISKPYVVPEYRKFHDLLCGQEFPSNFDKIKKEFENINKSNKPNIIISNESINGAIHKFNEKIIEYTFELFPNAKIIFSIRNQFDAIKSHYANHGMQILGLPSPHSGIMVKFDDYFEFNLKNLRKSYFQVINYNNFISLWEKYYKKENILILPLELMVSDKKKYFENLYKFLNYDFQNLDFSSDDLQLNKRNSIQIIYYNKMVNFIKTNLPFLRKFKIIKNFNAILIKYFQNKKKLDVKLSKKQIEIIKNIYGESNKRLNEKYKLKLENFGYIFD
tara:strand:- start:3622 stop:4536 length:915 start_codon:yes stop_codon:yes gene_type:complete